MKLLKQVARNVKVVLAVATAAVCWGQNNPAAPAPDGDRAAAYYNYTLAHMYANLAAESPNRTEYVQQALANYKGFGEKGFSVAAILDTDNTKVGRRVGGVVVSNFEDLAAIVAERSIAIAIIATPATGAQDVVDRLVAAGVRSILNFAPSVLSVGPGVSLRHVDLSMELQILSFYEHRMRTGAAENLPG